MQSSVLASPSPSLLDSARRAPPPGSPPLSRQNHTYRAGLHSPADQGDEPAPLFPQSRRETGLCVQAGIPGSTAGIGGRRKLLSRGWGWSAAGIGGSVPGRLYEAMVRTPEFSPSKGQHPPTSRLKVTPRTLINSPALPSGLACNQRKAEHQSGAWEGPRLPPTVDPPAAGLGSWVSPADGGWPC